MSLEMTYKAMQKARQDAVFDTLFEIALNEAFYQINGGTLEESDMQICKKIMQLRYKRMNSREKGARGERELAEKLNQAGIQCKRGYVQFKQSDLIGIKGIHVECKRVERLNIHDAMNQAISEAKKRSDGKPTVFHRRNNTEWLVTMRLSDWAELYKKGAENGNNL